MKYHPKKASPNGKNSIPSGREEISDHLEGVIRKQIQLFSFKNVFSWTERFFKILSWLIYTSLMKKIFDVTKINIFHYLYIISCGFLLLLTWSAVTNIIDNLAKNKKGIKIIFTEMVVWAMIASSIIPYSEKINSYIDIIITAFKNSK
ncbi:hypothetical protein [Gluconobacter sp. P1D12_c]|uniref:hypothetical protein n=1 Tax=Gluconobacter sp. P1D12_c TaxID=2762614 RepID=UPI001C05A6E2|nr:hypothetical protein [Gluconobacter sp. P1D12_c]